MDGQIVISATAAAPINNDWLRILRPNPLPPLPARVLQLCQNTERPNRTKMKDKFLNKKKKNLPQSEKVFHYFQKETAKVSAAHDPSFVPLPFSLILRPHPTRVKTTRLYPL